MNANQNEANWHNALGLIYTLGQADEAIKSNEAAVAISGRFKTNTARVVTPIILDLFTLA